MIPEPSHAQAAEKTADFIAFIFLKKGGSGRGNNTFHPKTPTTLPSLQRSVFWAPEFKSRAGKGSREVCQREDVARKLQLREKSGRNFPERNSSEEALKSGECFAKRRLPNSCENSSSVAALHPWMMECM